MSQGRLERGTSTKKVPPSDGSAGKFLGVLSSVMIDVGRPSLLWLVPHMLGKQLDMEMEKLGGEGGGVRRGKLVGMAEAFEGRWLEEERGRAF